MKRAAPPTGGQQFDQWMKDVRREVDNLGRQVRGRVSLRDGIVIGDASVDSVRADDGSLGLGARDERTGGAVKVLGGINKFTGLIGDGTSTVITVPHSLGTVAVLIQTYNASTGVETVATRKIIDEGTVELTFGAAPGVQAIRIIIIG